MDLHVKIKRFVQSHFSYSYNLIFVATKGSCLSSMVNNEKQDQWKGEWLVYNLKMCFNDYPVIVHGED